MRGRVTVRGTFGRLWAAHTVNVAGGALAPVALTLGIIDRGGSPGTLALGLTAGAVPAVLGFFLVRRLGSRLGAQRQAVVACAIGAVAQLGLAATLARPTVALVPLLVCAFGTGLAAALYFPAVPRLVRSAVPTDRLQSANASLSLSRSLATTVGPALGAALVVTLGASVALVLDALTFAVAAALLTTVSRAAGVAAPATPAAETPGAQTEERTAPLGDLLRRPWLWSSLLVFTVGNVVTPVFYVAGPLLVATDDGGFLQWGLVLGLVGAGAAVGDLVLMRVRVGRPLAASRLVELGITPVMVLLALSAPVAFVLVAALVCGAAKAIPDSLWYTALQHRLDDDRLSAVTSLDWMVSIGARPVGYLAAVPLVGAFGEARTLVGCSVLMVLTCLLTLLPADVRRFRVGVPEVRTS